MVCPSLKPRSSLGPWSGFSACLASSLCCFTHLQEGKRTEKDRSTTCLVLCQANPAQILPDKSSPGLRDRRQLFFNTLGVIWDLACRWSNTPQGSTEAAIATRQRSPHGMSARSGHTASEPSCVHAAPHNDTPAARWFYPNAPFCASSWSSVPVPRAAAYW